MKKKKKLKIIGSMEKLELKHLAPYLPYGLKYCRVHQSPIDLTDKIEFVGEVSTKGDELNINNNLLCEYLYMKYLPILRPLSDLTKYREDLGFVPFEFLAGRYNSECGEFLYRLKNNLSNIEDAPYTIINKISEWHFDVFGLIEKGLAIDINTFKQRQHFKNSKAVGK